MSDFDYELNKTDDLNFDNPKPKLSVIGIGGAGGNVINRMIEAKIADVEYVALNTDVMDLKKSLANNRLIMGRDITRGLGAGMKPEIGKKAAIEAEKDIKKNFENVDMLFIAAGMGGGTGTGAAPIVAEWALEYNILTIAVVTTPFEFEGDKRMKIALSGIDELKKHVDTIMVIPNQKLFDLDENKGQKLKLKEAFGLADVILKNAISGLTDLINKAGDINLDFADVNTVMHRKGKAIIGVGHAKGENRGRDASKIAMSSPLLKTDRINKATGVIINITADPELTLEQAKEACLVIEDLSPNADVIWGLSHDDNLKDEVHVTIIITGFENYHDGFNVTKTLSVRDSFKLYDGYETKKISELNDLSNGVDDNPQPQPKLNQEIEDSTDEKPVTLKNPETEPEDVSAGKNHSKVKNAYRLEMQDMNVIEDAAHVPDHFKMADSKNREVPAYIRRKIED